jgi:hypothetical protein
LFNNSCGRIKFVKMLPFLTAGKLARYRVYESSFEILYPRLALNSQSFCLSFLRVGITGMHNHAWLSKSFNEGRRIVMSERRRI